MAKKLNSPRKSMAAARPSAQPGRKSPSVKVDAGKPSKQAAKSGSKPAAKSAKATRVMKVAAGKSPEKPSEKLKKGKGKGRSSRSGSVSLGGKGGVSEPPDFEILDYEEAGQELKELKELKELEAFEAEHLEGASGLLDSETAEGAGGAGAPAEEVSSGVHPKEDEIILTDAEGRRLCRVRECDQAATVEAYCRFHYLQNWKRIQIRRKILSDGKLARYVDELTSRYPDKFLETIRRDLQTEKEFMMAIAELEIDENGADNDFEDEGQNFIDEVRGVSDTTISEDEEF